jgi:TM2 domain-containing membrane protein YozV
MVFMNAGGGASSSSSSSSSAAPVGGASPSYVINPKSKVVAGLLGIFLGGIGAHKFYLGRIGLGIVYLIFSWTFIPSFIGLIEGIIYLCMSEAEFMRKYCSVLVHP